MRVPSWALILIGVLLAVPLLAAAGSILHDQCLNMPFNINYCQGVATNIGSSGFDAFIFSLAAAGLVSFAGQISKTAKDGIWIREIIQRGEPTKISEIFKRKTTQLELGGGNFLKETLDDLEISRCNFAGLSKKRTILDGLSFNNATLRHVVFGRSNDASSVLKNVRFSGVTMINVDFRHCTFEGSGDEWLANPKTLRRLDFRHAQCNNTDFSNLTSVDAIFWGATMTSSKLPPLLFKKMSDDGLIENLEPQKFVVSTYDVVAKNTHANFKEFIVKVKLLAKIRLSELGLYRY